MFDVKRLSIRDPPLEVLALLERVIELLEKIDRNTTKGKPGRPRKERGETSAR